ncbi:MAG: MFS transporter [Rectinemataceae bacterium]
MSDTAYQSYPYRWVVLAVTMFGNLVLQILWISYAAIATQAASWYGVSEMGVGLFAMSFMIAFIPLSIPASWLIDRFGFARVLRIGAILLGVFGLLRGLAGHSYSLAILASFGMAAIQPLFMNSWTKMPAEWFPASERATAVGLTTLANILGAAIGLVVPPLLLSGMDMAELQFFWGALALGAGIVFAIFVRERPPTPPDAEAGRERALVLDGIKSALKIPSFRAVIAISFLGMGVFNGLTTWIDAIARPRGVDAETAGLLGALMLVGGILGAIVLPAISDRQGRRKRWIIFGLLGSLPFLVGMAFAQGFAPLAIVAAILGFFMVAVSPIAMQYAAEIARPSPEGATNGLFTLAGQSSVLVVYLMELINGPGGDFTLSLLGCAALMAVASLLAFGLKEAALTGKPAGV